MYSNFNQRVNANVEKLLNGASLYQVFLNSESLMEVLQSLKNYEIIKSWREDPDHEEYMEETRKAYELECDSPAFSWWQFESGGYSTEDDYDSYEDSWEQFCRKHDEIKNEISENLPSDRELWILRQARKAAKIFGYGYWNTGMKKAWPKFVQKYHLTTKEVDAFWIEYHMENRKNNNNLKH